ncbi:C-terminal binding protein [Ottowia thiooxydans]|uniref:D-3-phosphoglycerate dehydrogenase n=1 Tax=Ottowia thiooxydans TaxID=219182 RepID=A0ABV2Q409_9BURK
MRALITDTEMADPDIERKLLEAAGFEVTVGHCKTEADVIACAQGMDALLVTYAPVTAAVFAACPSVRMISRHGIGVDSIDTDAALEHGVWVSNVPDYGYDEVPTHAISLLFSLLRHITFHDRQVRSGVWNFAQTGRIDRIADMTLGIVGLGRLGRFTMELCRPFFKHVAAFDPFLPDDKWPAGVEKCSLEEVFQKANAISLHLPLNADTRHIVNQQLLSCIPERGAYLVNTSRGGLTDLDAVLAALDSGRLRGVGLDVLPVEPPAPDHPILHHPRAIVTPHAAFYSTESVLDLRHKFAVNVVAWKREGVAPNAVVRGHVAATA